jgi:hypothetical protein
MNQGASRDFHPCESVHAQVTYVSLFDAIQILPDGLPIGTGYLKLLKSRTKQTLSLFCFCRLLLGRIGIF